MGPVTLCPHRGAAAASVHPVRARQLAFAARPRLTNRCITSASLGLQVQTLGPMSHAQGSRCAHPSGQRRRQHLLPSATGRHRCLASSPLQHRPVRQAAAWPCSLARPSRQRAGSGAPQSLQPRPKLRPDPDSSRPPQQPRCPAARHAGRPASLPQELRCPAAGCTSRPASNQLREPSWLGLAADGGRGREALCRPGSSSRSPCRRLLQQRRQQALADSRARSSGSGRWHSLQPSRRLLVQPRQPPCLRRRTCAPSGRAPCTSPTRRVFQCVLRTADPGEPVHLLDGCVHPS